MYEQEQQTRTPRVVRLPRFDPNKIKTPEQLLAAVNQACAEARKSFWDFRCLMHPYDYRAWWQKAASTELEIFWRKFKAGKRPRLVLQAPPQHGKSTQVRDFLAYVLGADPSLKTIFTSYSDELGMETNLYLQRSFTMPVYQKIWGNTRVRSFGEQVSAGGARRNTGLIEFVGADGSFRNTTINGQINGFGLDIGVIDDPIKGRAEAQSKTTRDKVWNWLTDDFFGRFSKDAGFIMIMTRWHIDDPVGRWLERFPDTRMLRFSAVAEDENDWTVKQGYRKAGQALFPEHKPIDFLEERRKLLTEASWQSLYQQHPIVPTTGLFPVGKIELVDVIDRQQIFKSVRYWDKAGSRDAGAYTAGVLMHKLIDGRFLVEDVKRGQWSALVREQHIRQIAELDRKLCPATYKIWVEQEPGSGGKESAEATIRMLSGYSAFADKVSNAGSKDVRADPFAAQVQGGNVMCRSAEWLRDYFDELEIWPNGKYKDQGDASAGAFNKLTSGSSYNWTGSWVS